MGMAITKELPAKNNPASHTGAFYFSFSKNLCRVTTIIIGVGVGVGIGVELCYRFLDPDADRDPDPDPEVEY
jgi:hypothetical protein